MVVIGEPSGWNAITLGYKGSLWAEMTFHQSASHTASGQTSACDQAVPFWYELLQELISQFNMENIRVFDQLTPSIRSMDFTQIQMGLKISAIVETQYPYSTEVDLSCLQELLVTCTGFKNSNLYPEIKIMDYMPAYLGREKHSTCQSLSWPEFAMRAELPGFKLKTGTADMNLVGPAWNCPVIAYGRR